MSEQQAICDTHERYAFEHLGVTSDLAGPCDVCGDYCADTWLRKFEHYRVLGVIRRWTMHGEPVTGHLDCLEFNASKGIPHHGTPWALVEMFGYQVKRSPRAPGRIGCDVELIGPQGEVCLRNPSAAELKTWTRENLT